MTEYIGELYPIALDVGITPALFWDYSIQEITDIIDSRNRVLEFNRKNEYIRDYYLAKSVVEWLAPMLSKDAKPPELWNCAPDYVFEKEKEEIEKKRVEYELELHKERMREFAMRFNSQRANNML